MFSQLSAWLIPRIAGVSAEEISRQHQILGGAPAVRLSMTALTYGLACLFTSPLAVIACAIVDFSTDILGTRWMKNLAPARAPGRYAATMAALVTSQAAFSLMLALCYQSDVPLAQPFAAGVLTLTMLQLASIRVIHWPYAAVGLGTSVTIAAVAVCVDWQSRSGPAGLVLSLLALAAATYFVAEVIRANHALHAGIAAERLSARMANEAKSRFLAQMSHELRTPLNAILGLGHVELARAQTPESQERLRLVTEAARGLAVILDDILDMSAIEAGHLPIRLAPCRLREEISAAAALFRPLCEAQGLTLTLDLGPDLPERALLDAQRLRQCLSNLLSNALKHTTTGGIALRAGLTEEGKLAIIVADTGRGIPEAEAERIFQPFQRGPSDSQGSGLGLSITRALARSMGGDLHLLPAALGATFRLTLALGAAPAIPAPDAAPSEAAPPAAGPSGVPKRLKVLVVDDIATNRLVARAHLTLLGAETEEAASGEEAIAALSRNLPDLVFLDMNMPGLDGTATLRRIRTLPSRAARLPVIAMTADATEAHRSRYLAAGLDGYLAKPLTPEALREVLARHIPAFVPPPLQD